MMGSFAANAKVRERNMRVSIVTAGVTFGRLKDVGLVVRRVGVVISGPVWGHGLFIGGV